MHQAKRLITEKKMKARKLYSGCCNTNHVKQHSRSGWFPSTAGKSVFVVGLMSVLSGCEPKGSVSLTGVSSHTIVHDGLSREYIMYVPASYDGSSKLPLMFNFHGGGGDAAGQMYISDMRSLAEEENFIVIYPQGTALENGDGHWNTMISSEGNKSSTNDIGFISSLIDDLAVSHNIDTDRVYATGYSNGAGFAYTLGCHLSDKIAAIAPVSGLMMDQLHGVCRPSHPTGVLILNGTADGARPYEGIDGWLFSIDRTIEYWTSVNQTNAAAVVRTLDGGSIEHHAFTGGSALVEHYKFIDGGHWWFEIDDEGANIDRLIWNFVSRHDKNGLR